MMNNVSAIDNLRHPQCCDESDLRETIAAAIQAIKFKDYFDGLYGAGLMVANYHLNGDFEAFDTLYEEAMGWKV